MAEFPALPLFTDAFLADTAHLTDAECGLYLRILILMWRSPGCRIPNDDDWIGRHLRIAPDAMRTHVRVLLCEFCKTDGNWLSQKRLTKEYEWVKKNGQRMSALAKRRWNKDIDLSTDSTAPEAKHPTPPHLHKKDARAARGQNGSSGRSEGLKDPDTEAKARARSIAKGMHISSISDHEVRRMVAAGYLTAEQALTAGYEP